MGGRICVATHPVHSVVMSDITRLTDAAAANFVAAGFSGMVDRTEAALAAHRALQQKLAGDNPRSLEYRLRMIEGHVAIWQARLDIMAVLRTLRFMSVLDFRKPGPRQRVSLDTLGSSLGLKVSRTDQLINQVQNGLSFKALVSLKTMSGMTASEIASMIGIPARTLARRRAAGKLAPDESERLLRIATVFEKAVCLFEGDVPAALTWLRAPKKALSQQSPWTYARSELGAREVLDLIGRLEYGVFT